MPLKSKKFLNISNIYRDRIKQYVIIYKKAEVHNDTKYPFRFR